LAKFLFNPLKGYLGAQKKAKGGFRRRGEKRVFVGPKAELYTGGFSFTPKKGV